MRRISCEVVPTLCARTFRLSVSKLSQLCDRPASSSWLLSSPMLNLYHLWAVQGDEELRAGLSVTPFCDRRRVVVSASQLRFIDTFLRPLLLTLAWATGPAVAAALNAGLARTVAHWTEHARRVAARSAHPHLADLSYAEPAPVPAPCPPLALAACG